MALRIYVLCLLLVHKRGVIVEATTSRALCKLPGALLGILKCVGMEDPEAHNAGKDDPQHRDFHSE